MTCTTFAITTVDIDKNQHVPATCRFTRVPCVGELLTVDVRNPPPEFSFDVYEVIAVVHATDGGGSADIFVRRLGPGPVQSYLR